MHRFHLGFSNGTPITLDYCKYLCKNRDNCDDAIKAACQSCGKDKNAIISFVPHFIDNYKLECMDIRIEKYIDKEEKNV